MLFAILVVLLSQFIAAPASARTINVPDDYTTIQAAIDAAIDGDHVVLEPGTYIEHDIWMFEKEITIRSKDPHDENIRALTVIDGWNYGSWGEPIFEIYGCDTTTIISGVTMRGGKSDYAGAIHVADSSGVSVRECNIIYCQAASGGGISVGPNSSIIVDDCKLMFNEADTGAAISISRTDFPTICRIQNCIISQNYGANEEGILKSDRPVEIRNCIISDNRWSDWGGTITLNGPGHRLINCTIVGNRGSRGSTGAVYLDYISEADIRNCIIRENYPSQITTLAPEGLTVEYSNVEGGWLGVGNIDADPLFRAYRDFNYMLIPGSLCIDTGDPALEDGISDSHPRWPEWYPNSPRSDMGAYGGPGNIWWIKQ